MEGLQADLCNRIQIGRCNDWKEELVGLKFNLLAEKSLITPSELYLVASEKVEFFFLQDCSTACERLESADREMDLRRPINKPSMTRIQEPRTTFPGEMDRQTMNEIQTRMDRGRKEQLKSGNIQTAMESLP